MKIQFGDLVEILLPGSEDWEGPFTFICSTEDSFTVVNTRGYCIKGSYKIRKFFGSSIPEYEVDLTNTGTMKLGDLVMVRDDIKYEWKGPYILAGYNPREDYPYLAASIRYRYCRMATEEEVERASNIPTRCY